MMKDLVLSGKVAIVTGSSRGIGKAIAIELAKIGASVVINGRNTDRLAKAEKEIRLVSDKVLAVSCDVSLAEQAKYLVQKSILQFGHLDILINNVGVSMRGNFEDIEPDVFSRVFKTNVMGVINPTIPSMPYIKESRGSILFVSSLAGIRGLPSLSAYCSSKMALRAIAESIRIEEANSNIHIGLVQVGITEIEKGKTTIMADGSLKELTDRSAFKASTTKYVAHEILKNIKKGNLLQR